MRTIKYLTLLSGILVVSGCVEEKNLGKYDHYKVDTDKLANIEKVELVPAADQSLTAEPSLVSVQADQPNKLTIEQCRVLALQNNLTLKVDAINPQIAQESLKQAHARFEPLFISGFSFAANDYPTDNTENNNISGSGRVQLPLITGGSFNFAFPLSKSTSQGTYTYWDDNAGRMVTINSNSTRYTTGTEFQFSQPLLKGAGTEVNTYNIRLSSYSLQRTEINNKLSAMAVLVSVDKAFWQLYYAQEALKVRNLEYDLAKAQFEQAQRLLELKQVGQIEVLRAENSMAQRKTAIISAENYLRQTQRALKQILNTSGLEVESDSLVVAEVQPEPVKYKLDRNNLLEYALEHRPELLDFEVQLASQRDTLEFRKNSLLPSLALSYAYSFDGEGSVFSDSFDMQTSRDSNDHHRIGLDLSVPLGNRAAKSALRAALLQQEQIEVNKQIRLAYIKNEVMDAADNLDSAWNSIITTQNSADISKRTMEAEQRQFELGMQTSTDLLSAQADYANSLLARLNAQVQYQIAQVDLCYKVGGLNEAARVKFE